MRPAIIGVSMAIITAISLKNEKTLNSSVIRISLTTEIMMIIIFGLIEIN